MAALDPFEVLTSLLETINAAQDDTTRKQAEAALNSLEENDRTRYMQALATELGNKSKSDISRTLAGLILKNMVSSDSDEKRATLSEQWLHNTDNDTKNGIKTLVLQTLGDSVAKARHTAALVCAAIGLIEIPLNLWSELIPILLSHVTTGDQFLRETALETLGYICEEIDPSIINAEVSNQILTAVIQGMRKAEPSPEVRFAACTALWNALEFCSANFENEVERTFVINTIIEATTSAEENIRVAAFECLVKVAQFYYDKLGTHMQVLFEVTLKAMKTDVENVALQGVEFWSTICDEEIDLLYRVELAARNRTEPERVCRNFVEAAIQFLIPVLEECLTKQNELDYDDDDAWNIAMAAATCLSLIANTVLDKVVEFVMPYVQQNFNHQNWRLREASTLAFGSILEGPQDSLDPVIREALLTLIQHLKDENEHVKDTTAWVLGRISQLHAHLITSHLTPLMTGLVESLTDESPKVAGNSCWAITNVAESFLDKADEPTSPLSTFFTGCLTALLTATSREDSDEANLQVSAYEALNGLIRSSAQDCYPTIVQVIPVIVDALKRTLNTNGLDTSTASQLQEQTGLLCGVLQVITQKLEKQCAQFADDLVTLYIEVFATGRANHEALMGIGCITYVVEENFEKYMTAFAPYFLASITNWQEIQTCSIAVGIIGDISRALGSKFAVYCEQIVAILFENLRQPSLHDSIKPPILACFGDIALAIQANFLPYLQFVMTVLQQACGATVDQELVNDEETIEYINNLREAISEAYVGIINGLADGGKLDEFIPYLSSVMEFLGMLHGDPNRTEAITKIMIGILGDLARILGVKVKPFLHQDFVAALLDECADPEQSPTLQKLAVWAKGEISKL